MIFEREAVPFKMLDGVVDALTGVLVAMKGVDVEALAFTATTTDGTTFSGTDVVGQDILLWFWAPW